ncbi:MAG: hypothetical protein ABIS45_16415 [Burkholderiales bacterium]
MLGVVFFDFHPRDFAGFINQQHGRVGNAFAFQLYVARILQSVDVDDAVLRIGQQRKRNRPAAFGGNLLREPRTFFMRIWADAPQRDLLAGLEQGSEFGKLPNAVRSPVAAKKYQDDRLPAALGG